MPTVSRRPASLAVLASGLGLPMFAVAHPEHAMLANSAAGFVHPLTGMDHLLAMLAVGIWAAKQRTGAWGLLAIFPLAMVIGAILAVAGLGLPAVEPMIALSVVVLGAAVALGLQIAPSVAAGLIALFALFHGHAHALEGPSSAGPLFYGVGFISSTVLLHLSGLGLGRIFVERERVTRLGGSAIAAAGAVMLFV